jgi:hypothetical protein
MFICGGSGFASRLQCEWKGVEKTRLHYSISGGVGVGVQRQQLLLLLSGTPQKRPVLGTCICTDLHYFDKLPTYEYLTLF